MIRLTARGAFRFAGQGPAGPWTLVEGEAGEAAVPLGKSPFVIGRALDCDLRLPHSPALAKRTSRWHCHILAGREGPVVVDGSVRPAPETGKLKPSIAGTVLDGRRLSGPAPLCPGGVLDVGPWRFGVDAAPGVDLDAVLKSPGGRACARGAPDDPQAAQAFARLHGLFRRLETAGTPAEGLGTVLSYALADIPAAVVAAILEEAPDGSLSVRAAVHRTEGPLADLRFSAALFARLPADRSILLPAGAGRPTQSQVQERISSGLVVPILGRGGRTGFLYMDNRRAGGTFTQADLYFAEALASVAALQLSLERQSFLSRLEQNMRQYFGPDVVRVIVKASREGKPLGLGVSECSATILFVDLQGFSAFCRERTPAEVSELLSPYYKLVSDCVQAEGGHVDKFLGDGVMGVFGAQPLRAAKAADADHARSAARCARRVMAAWADGSLFPWRMRVSLRAGLHTGPVVAGNIGFVGRMEYSVIGDAVNLAARMEKFAGPNATALTDATRRLVEPEFPCSDGGLKDIHGFGMQRVWHLA